MVDKNDPISHGKWARKLPEVDRLLKQFCKYESAVDAKVYDLRHLYMEPCSNPVCGPLHLTDRERDLVMAHVREMEFEDAILKVIGGRGASGA